MKLILPVAILLAALSFAPVQSSRALSSSNLPILQLLERPAIPRLAGLGTTDRASTSLLCGHSRIPIKA